MKPILNVSAYRFVELNDAASLRESMRSRAEALGLRGTIILAVEGINLALAGAREPLEEFVAGLESDARFAGMDWKRSDSDALPFGRLRVKLKREIIRMNQPAVRPQQQRAPALHAATLARWLDQGADDAGRELALLDTRNGFEVERGRFRDAIDWQLQRFSDFPTKLNEQKARLAGKTVVSYCTGGIRCEKAALWMLIEGVQNVWQLDGGILKYFELQGGRHFEGSCFVFDERDALANTLAPAGAA